jgi:hypothetical protein
MWDSGGRKTNLPSCERSLLVLYALARSVKGRNSIFFFFSAFAIFLPVEKVLPTFENDRRAPPECTKCRRTDPEERDSSILHTERKNFPKSEWIWRRAKLNLATAEGNFAVSLHKAKRRSLLLLPSPSFFSITRSPSQFVALPVIVGVDLRVFFFVQLPIFYFLFFFLPPPCRALFFSPEMSQSKPLTFKDLVSQAIQQFKNPAERTQYINTLIIAGFCGGGAIVAAINYRRKKASSTTVDDAKWLKLADEKSVETQAKKKKVGCVALLCFLFEKAENSVSLVHPLFPCLEEKKQKMRQKNAAHFLTPFILQMLSHFYSPLFLSFVLFRLLWIEFFFVDWFRF